MISKVGGNSMVGFHSFCTRHSKFPFPPSVVLSGPFQPQDTKNTKLWKGIYGKPSTVIKLLLTVLGHWGVF